MFNTADPVPDSFVARRKKVKKILRQYRFVSRSKLIQLAAGDWARLILPDEPLLARKGEPGYDPFVEKEVRAALTHKHLLSREMERKIKRARSRERILQPGMVKKEGPAGGFTQRILKITRPWSKIRQKISSQQKGLTAVPEKIEVPPEFLPKERGKIPVRGASYEGTDVPDLWSREEAAKPSNVKFFPAEKVHPHKRPLLSQHEISVRGRAYRDPLASHLARVEAGMTPSLIQTREKPVKGLPPKFLPKVVSDEERRRAQAIRDVLAQRVRERRSVLKSYRSLVRAEQDLPQLRPMSKTKVAELWGKSERMGYREIARKTPFEKPRIGTHLPVAVGALHPADLAAAHRELEQRVAAKAAAHVEKAKSIRQNVADRLIGTFKNKPEEYTPRVREAVQNLTKGVFHPENVVIDDWQAKQLAEHLGTSEDWVRKTHARFVHHRSMGETAIGEEKIRKAIMPHVVEEIPRAYKETISPGYPALKRLGRRVGIGAGVGAGLIGGAYLLKKALGRKKETRFATKEKESTLGHDIAIGGIEGGLGYLATDPIIKRIRPKSRFGQFGIAATVGGIATGSIGLALNKAVKKARAERQKRQFMAQLREIRFAYYPPSTEGASAPYNPKRKLTVAQDRYRKMVREREIYRKEANIAKSAVAGAVLAGVIHRKVKLPSLAAGAAAGTAAQTGLLLHGRKTRDPFGEESIASKRIERIPWQAGGLAAAGIVGHRLYRRHKLSAKGKLIQFQDINIEKPGEPWHEKQVRRWLQHPAGRIRETQKWVARGQRFRRDIKAQRTAEGDIVDERGRVRTPEWRKEWFKRALVLGGGIAVAAATRHGIGRLKKTAAVAGESVQKGFPVSKLTPGEKFSMYATSGNIGRAIARKFPKISGAFGKAGRQMSGIREELSRLKGAALTKANKAIASQVGDIQGAKVIRDKEGNIVKVHVITPAQVIEGLKKSETEEAAAVQKVKGRFHRTRERLKKAMQTRSALEKATKPPSEPNFRSKGKLIQFQDYERVYVPAHTRKRRRQKRPEERKGIREGFLIGAGSTAALGGTAAGVRWGIRKSSKEAKAAAAKKYQEEIAEAVAKKLKTVHIRNLRANGTPIEFAYHPATIESVWRRLKKPSRKTFGQILRRHHELTPLPTMVFRLSKRLDDLIQFAEKDRKKQRAKWGAVAGGVSGGVSGGILGAYAGTMHPEAIGAFTGEAIQKGLHESMESIQGELGESWKPKGHGIQEPFQHGAFGPAEAKARKQFIERKLLNKRVLKRIGKFAGVGATGLGAIGALGGYASVRAGIPQQQRQLSALLDDLIEFKLFIPSEQERKKKVSRQLPFRQGEILDYVEQSHLARRAGSHTDIRIGDRLRGMYSWATKKDLPESGGKPIRLHPQPIHPQSYNVFQGEIPEGEYGAGTVRTKHLGKALVTKTDRDKTNVTLLGKRGPHRLAFIRTKLGHLLVREKHPDVEASKPKMKTVPHGKAEEYLRNIPSGTLVQPKVDGALVYVSTKGGQPEIFSHRTSKQTGKQILHTERFFKGRPTFPIPKEHQRTILGELYGTRQGKAIPPQELGGILNAHIGKSISRQKAHNVKLKIMPFDLKDGKEGNYSVRLGKLRKLLAFLPKDKFHLPETVGKDDALKLHRQIKSGRHPLTREGVIVRPPEGKPVRIKNLEETDVKIHSLFPGKGKFEGGYGGFYYKTKSGKLGKVGTGFSDETRRELPQYVGRWARIRHQGIFEGGKHRAPALIAIHESKNP